MIFIGIGSNLPGTGYTSPLATCDAAIEALSRCGIRPLRCSRWYSSAPVPPSDQPWYVNGVAHVETAMDSDELLAELHRVEAGFGRVRGPVGAPRTLDLDLLDMDGRIANEDETVTLPHPRLHERAFVLRPLAELAPEWRHPATGLLVEELIAALDPEQRAEPIQTAPFRQFY